MIQPTIRADGMEWPLETYLDARGFIRTNGEIPDFAGHAGLVDIVTTQGELRENVEAITAPWHEVIATHPADGSKDFSLCDGCGERMVATKWHTEPGTVGAIIVIDGLYCRRCADHSTNWLGWL